ncbi:MAG TPA: DUF1579 domain-containing protein [Tepidisphaeraceae bacterium]|nr:DUF1579 domain-containing protein [Tepidisphaeraceae bacterium]
MSFRKLSLVAVAACACAAIVGSRISFAEDQGGMPNMTPEMQKQMEAYMAAGMVGEQHTKLAKWVGTWSGDMTMHMPGMPSMTASQTWVVSSVFDGRFIKCDVNSEMPGMGPFVGIGFTGFDNVSQKFVSTWMDSMGTGIMSGTGDLSDGDKTFTMVFETNCPVTKKVVPFREVMHFVDDKTMHVEFFGIDPNTGKEMKCMETKLTKK